MVVILGDKTDYVKGVLKGTNSLRYSRLQKLEIDVTRKVRHTQWNCGEPCAGTLKIGPCGPQCE